MFAKAKKAIPIPSTTRAPALVHANSITSPADKAEAADKDLSMNTNTPASRVGDPRAVELLQRLKNDVERFPRALVMDQANPASSIMQSFVGDPSACDPNEDGWETLDPLLNNVAGLGLSAGDVLIKIRSGGWEGVTGLVNFIAYFVEHRGVTGDLLENKMGMIIEAVKSL